MLEVFSQYLVIHTKATPAQHSSTTHQSSEPFRDSEFSAIFSLVHLVYLDSGMHLIVAPHEKKTYFREITFRLHRSLQTSRGAGEQEHWPREGLTLYIFLGGKECNI